MKNSIKKVLCTAVAAVSLSALVTVPSSLNKPNSDNAIVTVMEAEAKAGKQHFDAFLYTEPYKKTNFLFKVTKDTLWGRDDVDGKKVHKLGKGAMVSVDKITVEKSNNGEYRIWAHSSNKIDCNQDHVKRNIWICVYKNKTKQVESFDSSLNNGLKNIAGNYKWFLENYPNTKTYRLYVYPDDCILC